MICKMRYILQITAPVFGMKVSVVCLSVSGTAQTCGWMKFQKFLECMFFISQTILLMRNHVCLVYNQLVC